MTPEQRSAHRLLDRAGGAESVVPELHGALAELVRRRPRTIVVEPVVGDVDATARLLLDRIGPTGRR